MFVVKAPVLETRAGQGLQDALRRLCEQYPLGAVNASGSRAPGIAARGGERRVPAEHPASDADIGVLHARQHRRGFESLFDCGRQVPAKGFGRADTGYKAIARELHKAGIVDVALSKTVVEMAGYGSRLVNFDHEVTIEEPFRMCAERLSDIELIAQNLRQWIRDHPEHIDGEP